jgi:hypothetical protein
MNDEVYGCGCTRDGGYFCSNAHRVEAERIAENNRAFRNGCAWIVGGAVVCFVILATMCAHATQM